MAAAQKHRACKRPGRPFCDKSCNKTWGLATNLPCDKPVEDCSTLHGGPRQGFVTEGPRQKFATEGGGGGPRQTPISSHTHMMVARNVCPGVRPSRKTRGGRCRTDFSGAVEIIIGCWYTSSGAPNSPK